MNIKSIFTFGKKKRRSLKKKSKVVSVKLPKKLLSICKKLKVKVTVKRGTKKVYKSLKVLKKECLKKIKVLKKKYSKKSTRKSTTRSTRRVRTLRRGARFGGSLVNTSSKYSSVVPNNGYSQDVYQNPGINIQSSTPNGVYKEFFGAKVPGVLPPEWDYLKQPDGSSVAVGSPFYSYFGRHRRVSRKKSRKNSKKY
jgi:hypothetical protein